MSTDVATQFVQYYYTQFDTNRANLAALYTEQSMLTFEGEQYQGVQSIMNKLGNLGFQTIQHNVQSMDVQPSSTPGAMIVMVGGLLQMDGENTFRFSQVFHLHPTQAGSFYVFNDVFRLIFGQ